MEAEVIKKQEGREGKKRRKSNGMEQITQETQTKITAKYLLEKKGQREKRDRRGPHLTHMLLALPQTKKVLRTEATGMDVDLLCRDKKDQLPIGELR